MRRDQSVKLIQPSPVSMAYDTEREGWNGPAQTDLGTRKRERRESGLATRQLGLRETQTRSERRRTAL